MQTLIATRKNVAMSCVARQEELSTRPSPTTAMALVRQLENNNAAISSLHEKPSKDSASPKPPPAMKGLRWPKEIVVASLHAPKQGCSREPQSGGTSQIRLVTVGLTPMELKNC